MNMRIIPLFFALLVSLVYVDARHILPTQDSGKEEKLAEKGVTSVRIQNVDWSTKDLSPDFICLSCLEVSRKTVKALSDPSLVEKVGKFVEDACHTLPSDMRFKCVETLGMRITQAIEFLHDYLREEILCNGTGLCHSNANSFPMLNLGKDLHLSLDHYLLNKHAVNPNLLPKVQISSSMLQKFINKFDIISQMDCVRYLEPQFFQVTATKLFKWIGHNNWAGQNKPSCRFIGFELMKISDDNSCAACHSALEEVRDGLDDPEMKIKLIRILLKACDKVENHVKDCKRMVMEYGPLIMTNIGKFLSDNDLCSMIHICKPTTHNTVKTIEDFRPLIELRSNSDAISK